MMLRRVLSSSDSRRVLASNAGLWRPLASQIGNSLTDQAASRREVHATHLCARKVPSHSDQFEGNETLLTQQLENFMAQAEEKQKHTKAVDPFDQQHGDEEGNAKRLALSGLVIGVGNGMATISGLRDASIGSVIAIYASPKNHPQQQEEEEQTIQKPMALGVVLLLQKKTAHIALFDGEVGQVRIDMVAKLQAKQLFIQTNPSLLKGKVVDPFGKVMEADCLTRKSAKEQPSAMSVIGTGGTQQVQVSWSHMSIPKLMTRGLLRNHFHTGFHAIDCLKPVAHGHRFGLLGPRNVGKTRMTLDLIAKHVKYCKQNNTEPPRFVYVCIGKAPNRIAQIAQFLDQADALEYTTVVAASDRECMAMQFLAPFAGVAMAELLMRESPTKKSVVVYDELASHMLVVENLVHSMKLAKPAKWSLSGHSVLLERSAQFVGGESLTTFALADTPDSSAAENSELKQNLCSMVDDFALLESTLSFQRIYPPLNVLLPGGSVRGPPFQRLALWNSMRKMRARINSGHTTEKNIRLTRKLGFEMEPEHEEVLEYRRLVQQFFSQQVLELVPQEEIEIGAYYLAHIQFSQLPPSNSIDFWPFISDITKWMETHRPQELRAIRTHAPNKPWSTQLERALHSAFEAARTKSNKSADK